ncbi:G20.3 [Klebsiella pneumoniae]|uniref:G20.3 n=1 Tax=Klebsiella pneumoniae TaxID=573 RepID=A0A4P0Y1M0_KLEPN|nr:G20.3 [Klebsiella pneumoniae]
MVTTLLLAGAQTPGRNYAAGAQRMYEFSDMAEVESVLEGLTTREDGPFVARLPREPGENGKAAICICFATIWTR